MTRLHYYSGHLQTGQSEFFVISIRLISIVVRSTLKSTPSFPFSMPISHLGARFASRLPRTPAVDPQMGIGPSSAPPPASKKTGHAGGGRRIDEHHLAVEFPHPGMDKGYRSRHAVLVDYQAGPQIIHAIDNDVTVSKNISDISGADGFFMGDDINFRIECRQVMPGSLNLGFIYIIRDMEIVIGVNIFWVYLLFQAWSHKHPGHVSAHQPWIIQWSNSAHIFPPAYMNFFYILDIFGCNISKLW